MVEADVAHLDALVKDEQIPLQQVDAVKGNRRPESRLCATDAAVVKPACISSPSTNLNFELNLNISHQIEEEQVRIR